MVSLKLYQYLVQKLELLRSNEERIYSHV